MLPSSPQRQAISRKSTCVYFVYSLTESQEPAVVPAVRILLSTFHPSNHCPPAC